MILVDTSIWIDHLHRTEPRLQALLGDVEVCVHPMVTGELALGSLRDRTQVLALLNALPQIRTATHAEVAYFVEHHGLFGIGVSLVDAHLLAALRLSPGDRLWTREQRLHQAADQLGVAARP